jgi:xylose dehydrogenase (NAD/NADP)
VSPSLRWGVLGTAHINRRLIPAMRSARRSQLLAVASRDSERAIAYGREWNIPVTHGSYDALLHDRSVDAVYVPLPNTLHVEWTLRALDAGKHVLCEKPLALVPDDVDRIAAVARARALVVAEAFMYRHEPLAGAIAAVVRSGAIGPVWLITAGFTYRQDRVADVRLDPSLGGGSLWDIGCYGVNVARLIAGVEPVRVMGTAVMAPAGVDESFCAVLQFPAGLAATVHSSFRADYRTWLEVNGTSGVLRVTNIFRPGLQEYIEVQREGDIERVAIDGSSALFVRQIEDFVAAALDGKTPAVSLVDSRGNAAALAALHQAAATGQAVTI